MNELTQSLIARIVESHRAVKDATSDLQEVLIRKVNAARSTGFFLSELRHHLRRQRNFFSDDRTKNLQWCQMFRSGGVEIDVSALKEAHKPLFVFDFTVQTARTYMRLAEALPKEVATLPEAFQCLKDVLIATGALSAPSGHGSQSRRDGSFFSLLVRHAGRFDALWKKHDADRFVREMTPEAREQIKRQLEPLKARLDAILEAAGTPL